MDKSLDPAIITEILLQLIVGHHYERSIIAAIPNIAFLINQNAQLTSLFKSILSHTYYMTSREISWSSLNPNEQDIINNFFEYLYFTSPQFLKEVK